MNIQKIIDQIILQRFQCGNALNAVKAIFDEGKQNEKAKDIEEWEEGIDQSLCLMAGLIFTAKHLLTADEFIVLEVGAMLAPDEIERALKVFEPAPDSGEPKTEGGFAE